MRKTILFIAMSLDGYIADSCGGVGWLDGQETKGPDSYSAFVKNVDTVIMGWNTYHQIVTELSPEVWVYENLISYVITHRKIPDKGNILFTQQNPCALIRRLAQERGRDIWICGGADLIRQLMEEDLIDTYYLSIIPIILGDGIRLFHPLDRSLELRLLQARRCGGIEELIYERKSR